MKYKKTASLIALSFILVSCGSKPGERALSGGAIGAAVGGVGTTIVGASPLPGVLVGGAVGAAVGGLTKKKDINLGDVK